jgi:trehalose 6-phosphate phosphatase
MEFTSPEARAHYQAVVDTTGPVVVGLDFDGTLSPIVDDPASASIHADAPEALAALAQRVAVIAVVTGRPIAHLLTHGGVEALADTISAEGADRAELVLLGQYGNERWSSRDRTTVTPEPPAGLAALREGLPTLLAGLDLAGDPYVEDKGLAFAVHTRRMPEPAAAYAAVLAALTEAATAHDLQVEPGRFVVEVRGPGTNKGDAVRSLAAEHAAAGFVFVGDDLGDAPAFEAVRELADDGVAGLLVASGSTEQRALVDLADVVVDGPDGVVALLGELAADRSR